MPSTDVDGSPILILDEAAARLVLAMAMTAWFDLWLSEDQWKLCQRIVETFGINPDECPPGPIGK